VKLQRIEHFIEVVDAGSIRGAARRLGISQPGLSRSLQQLEEDLGVRLVERGVRGASLTLAGRTFLARARVAQTELRKAADEARSSVDEGSELLTFGMSPVALSLLMPELATAMQRARPRSRMRILELAPSALLPMVREGDAELAATQRTRAHLDAGLKYRHLFEIQLRVAARPGHPLAGKRQLHELVGAAWLAQTAPGVADDITRQSFLALGLPAPRPAMHWGSYSDVVFEAIAASDMLITLPPPLLRSLVARGKVIEIPLTTPLVPLRVGLYTRSDSPLSPSAKAAVQIIVEIARRFAAAKDARA
jgi:LysR family transcriptional regulator, regulator of abg operon